MEGSRLMKIGKMEALCAKGNSTLLIVGHTTGHVYRKEHVEKALKATIEKHPKLRVNKDKTHENWKFISNPYVEPVMIDMKSDSFWEELVLQQMNEKFNLGEDSSLLRFFIIQSGENAQIIFNQDHSVCDGFSGYILIDTFLNYYSKLEVGEDLGQIESLRWPESEDKLNYPEGYSEEEEKKIEEVKAMQENYIKSFTVQVETKMNPDSSDWRNFALFKDGTEENFRKVKATCKKHNISISSLIMAAYNFMIAKTSKNDWKEQPTLKNITSRVTADLRGRLKTPLGSEDASFYAAGMTLDIDLSLDDDFWDFCHVVQAYVKQRLDQNLPVYFNQSASYVNFSDPEIIQSLVRNNGTFQNLILSNMGGYPFKTTHSTKAGDIKITKFYCAGSPWCPFLAAYFIGVHSVSHFTYSFIFDYYEGKAEMAKRLFEGIIDLVENSHSIEKMSLQDFLGK